MIMGVYITLIGRPADHATTLRAMTDPGWVLLMIGVACDNGSVYNVDRQTS